MEPTLLRFVNTTQVFEVLTMAALFTYEPYEPCGLDATSAHLWQMMGFTGENFTPQQLGASQLSSMYFNEQCTYSFLIALGK